MSTHPEDAQKQVQQRAFENVTVGGNFSVELTQIVNLGLQPSINASSFCSLIEWIYEKSDSSSLERLPPCYSKKIVEILKRKCSQKQDRSSLDFTDFETKIFNLVFNFCHYYLQGGKPRLDKYDKFQKEDYYLHMKELINTGGKIRTCSIRLSSIVADREMSKLVQEVERTNEF